MDQNILTMIYLIIIAVICFIIAKLIIRNKRKKEDKMQEVLESDEDKEVDELSSNLEEDSDKQ